MCRLEVYDYQTQLRFRVFGADGEPVLNVTDLLLSDLLDADKLRLEIRNTRLTPEQLGVSLNAWICPW